MRFFIQISYNGLAYHGWQQQTNANSIQQEINLALSTILNKKIKVTGAGRTDSGVHAMQMFAHFDCDIDFQVTNIIFKLNNFLPDDIAVNDMFKVRDNANSRFDAVSRIYEYHIINSKNPFIPNAYLFQRDLDLVAMNDACHHLIGLKDFSSFSKAKTQTFTNNCNVSFAKWVLKDKELIFTIQADRFLRNMVRAIVGTLLDVGIGKIEPDEIAEIILAKDRCRSGVSAPAKALFLVEVRYPDKIRL